MFILVKVLLKVKLMTTKSDISNVKSTTHNVYIVWSNYLPNWDGQTLLLSIIMIIIFCLSFHSKGTYCAPLLTTFVVFKFNFN